MNVRLISITKPVLPEIEHFTPEEYMAFVARVSNPANQMNSETSSKLLGYCIKNAHWSVFEHVSLTFEIKTSRAIAAQILRHRSGVFQEFCIAGDSNIRCILPSGAPYTRTIEHIYNRFSRGLSYPTYVRVFNEDTREFERAKIIDVFKTGVKPVFEVELHSGHKIKCTKEHKFLTENGFLPLEEAAKMEIFNNVVTFDKNVVLATNGVGVHQDKEWLRLAKERSIVLGGGVSRIAKEAGVSYHTIRKWLKIHGLVFTRNEAAKTFNVWNKGKSYTRKQGHSEQTREKMRKKAKRGTDSNFWKGGVDRSERLKISDYIHKYRSKILKDHNFTCTHCGGVGGKLQLHHIEPVYKRLDLAYDLNNITVVHKNCHSEIHKINGDAKFWNEHRNTPKLTIGWSKIKNITYIGEEMTYDLQVDHPSHNYVANSIVVHNSQRYATALENEIYPARRQDTKNRQNSIDDMSQEDRDWFAEAQQSNWDEAFALYQEALARGIAKEQARFLLPLSTQTTLYFTNNVRNWIHYIDLRSGNGTQKEHMDIANEIKDIFIDQFPAISEAKGWNVISNESKS